MPKGKKTKAQLLREAEAAVDGHHSVKGHKALRGTCKHCGGAHSTSQHRSHGTGSFERTHGDVTYRLGRSLHLGGGEEMLELMEPHRRRR